MFKRFADKHEQYQKAQQERRKMLLVNIEALLQLKWWRKETRGKKSYFSKKLKK